MTSAKLVGDWKKMQKKFEKLPAVMRKNLEVATARCAKKVEKAIKVGIARGRDNWAPNAPLTKAVKGSSKPLVRHGDLMNSVNSRQISAAMYFIGINRNARNDEGVPMVNIGRVHEYGMTITPKTARMLALPLNPEADELARRAGGVRNIPGLHPMGGSKVLALEGQPMFALVESVTIPPRPFLFPALEETTDDCVDEFEQAVRFGLEDKPYYGIAS